MNDGSAKALTHDALVERVEFLMERNRYGQARAMVGEGLAQHPESESLLYYSAFIDWVEDRLDPAQRTLQQLLRLDPEHYGGRTLLGRLLAERKDLSGAEGVWLGLLKDYPEEPDLYARYGELMLSVLEVGKAGRLAEEGLCHDPENEHCLYVAAMAQLIEGQGLGDNQQLAMLVSRHPEHLRTGTMLVVALQEKGRTRDALAVSQQLLRAEPGNALLLENVRTLKAATHWSMLPLYPIQRWGWPAVFALWALFAFGLPRVAPGLPTGLVVGIQILWLLYAVYSWVWPPVLRKFI